MSRWTKERLRERAAHLRRSVDIGEHQGGLDDYGAMRNDAEICDQAASDAETLETLRAKVQAWLNGWKHLPPSFEPDYNRGWIDATKTRAEEVLALLDPPSAQGTHDKSEPISQPSPDRSQPIRRDLARLLDRLYGLHLRPGHIDAVLEVVQLHAPVKVPLSAQGTGQTPTCETCKFNKGIYQTEGDGKRLCSLPFWQDSADTDNNTVPVTINGQPFSCAGWQAKEGA